MPVGQTNRRAFIAALGGAAAWPATLVAQVPTRRPLIAYLAVASPEASATMVSAFLQSLRELGYRDGQEFGRMPVSSIHAKSDCEFEQRHLDRHDGSEAEGCNKKVGT